MSETSSSDTSSSDTSSSDTSSTSSTSSSDTSSTSSTSSSDTSSTTSTTTDETEKSTWDSITSWTSDTWNSITSPTSPTVSSTSSTTVDGEDITTNVYDDNSVETVVTDYSDTDNVKTTITQTTTEPDGSISINEYTSINGNMQTSYHTTNVGTANEYTTDTHYHNDNSEYGVLAEAYADISEWVDIDINENVAKGVEVVGSIFSVFINTIQPLKLGVNLIQAGQTYGDTLVQLSGYLVGISAYDNLLEEMENLVSVLGIEDEDFSTYFYEQSDTNSDFNIKIDTSTIMEHLIVSNKKKIIAEEENPFTYTIFDKMAGGRLYESQFAGNIYFDATTPPNTAFSVGEPFTLTDEAILIDAPYSKFLPLNQAGTDSFKIS